MTPEAQRIAIAKVCGWTEITFTGCSYQGIIPHDVSPRYCNWHRPAPSPCETDKRAWYWLPDYLHDLNAMHEAEKVLKFSERIDYIKHLQRIMGVSEGFIVVERQTTFATAAQRAEAFLRTLNLWK